MDRLRLPVLGIWDKGECFAQLNVVTHHRQLLAYSQAAEQQHYAENAELGVNPVSSINDAPSLLWPKPAADDATTPALGAPYLEIETSVLKDG
jgi:hypothetical protein